MEALIVDHGEALDLARELARRRGTSVNEAVVTSLRAALGQTAPARTSRPVPTPTLSDLTPEERADYEAMRALVREVAASKAPGATSDHGDLYDAHGLPV